MPRPATRQGVTKAGHSAGAGQMFVRLRLVDPTCGCAAPFLALAGAAAELVAAGDAAAAGGYDASAGSGSDDGATTVAAPCLPRWQLLRDEGEEEGEDTPPQRRGQYDTPRHALTRPAGRSSSDDTDGGGGDGRAAVAPSGPGPGALAGLGPGWQVGARDGDAASVSGASSAASGSEAMDAASSAAAAGCGGDDDLAVDAGWVAGGPPPPHRPAEGLCAA